VFSVDQASEDDLSEIVTTGRELVDDLFFGKELRLLGVIEAS